VSSLLLLRLFHQSLPYLKSNIRELVADSTDKAAFEKVSLSFIFSGNGFTFTLNLVQGPKNTLNLGVLLVI